MLSIARNERAALQFDDVASALDAGLPVTALGGDAAAGDRVVHGILARRGVQLTATEDAVLVHTWRAGRISAALRERASARQRQADFARTVWNGLRYPLLLFALILCASAATAAIVGKGILLTVVVTYALLGVLFVFVRGAVHRGAPWLQRVPLLPRLIAGLAELPYLETLQALYGAGVPLKEAHHAAVGTVRAGDVRSRLRHADRILDSGRPLREALTEARALHGETQLLLATGEQTGQLEDALGRALARRQDVTGRDVANTARWIGNIAYAAAVGSIMWIVLSFYSSYSGGIRGLTRH